MVREFAGFNVEEYERCVATHESALEVLDDENLAKMLGVEVTPTIFVNGKKIVGIESEQEFKAVLQEYVRRARKSRGGASGS